MGEASRGRSEAEAAADESARRASGRGDGGRPAPGGGAPPADTRERILSAATELFARQGYGATTIRQVADRAGANSMLIYYYFGSKQELFHAAMGEPARRVREMLERAAAGSGEAAVTVRERLEGFAREYLAAALSNSPAVTAMVRSLVGGDRELAEWIRPRLAANLKILRGLIEEGVERGEFRGVDPRLAAGSLMGMLFFYATMGPIAIPALDLGEEADLPRVLAEHTVRVLVEGIRRSGGES